MSPINFHFHLDPDKPDEARAFQILGEWQRVGWDIQKIMVAALLALQPQGSAEQNASILEDIQSWLQAVSLQTNGTLDETQKILGQVEDLLAQMRHLPPPSLAPHETEPPPQTLSAEFIASLKNVRKPGFRLED